MGIGHASSSLEVQIVRRPDGPLQIDDFRIAAVDLPDIGSGDVLVRNRLLSIDPSQRVRMRALQSLGEAMIGEALGQVVASRNPAFPEGSFVISMKGMREAFVDDGRGLTPVDRDPDLPISAHLHVFGRTGFTAYGGLLRIAALREGETVFVSSAAGAVGSIAAQIALLHGCKVIGSAGSAEKLAWLRSIGLHHVIDYRAQPIAEALANIGCKIDVYYDNVGGDHLDAALAMMNELGRVAVCGMIASYNGDGAAVHNLPLIGLRRINIRGFHAADFGDLHDRFRTDMAAWLKSGQIVYRETMHDGIALAPQALIGIMTGQNLGKSMVRLA